MKTYNKNWDQIMLLMDGDILEYIRSNLSPCSNQEILIRYLEIVPEFEKTLAFPFNQNEIDCLAYAREHDSLVWSEFTPESVYGNISVIRFGDHVSLITQVEEKGNFSISALIYKGRRIYFWQGDKGERSNILAASELTYKNSSFYREYVRMWEPKSVIKGNADDIYNAVTGGKRR